MLTIYWHQYIALPSQTNRSTNRPKLFLGYWPSLILTLLKNFICDKSKIFFFIRTTWWDVLRPAFCNLDMFLLATVSGPLWNVVIKNFGGRAFHFSRTLEAGCQCHADAAFTRYFHPSWGRDTQVKKKGILDPRIPAFFGSGDTALQWWKQPTF